MAKFDKVKNNISDVKKVEAQKGQRITLENILPENLISDPSNRENITYTEDLEYSMREVGFADPLEVTDFNMDNGKYMILSGHRRFEAGKKVGFDIYPCVVRHFENEEQIRNYNMLMNMSRNEAQDPLLYFNRYLMAVEYLDSIGFSGSEGEKDKIIATRISRSVQQASRFKALTKVIDKVIDLIREDKVGISSVTPLAPLSEEEQTEVYNIFLEVLADGKELTRSFVSELVKAYKNGGETWEDIKALNSEDDSVESTEETLSNDIEEVEEENTSNNNEETSPSPSGSDSYNDDTEMNNGDSGETEEEKEIKRGKKIMACLGSLDKLLREHFSFKDDEDSSVAIQTMMTVCSSLVDNANNVSVEMVDGGFDVFMSSKRELKEYLDNL